MTLRVYNTLSRQKEVFETVKPGRVGMYLCGPTVYKPPHVGHMVGPVIFDAVKRYLVYKGYAVTWVVNITDVDDKLIAAAAEEGTDMKSLAEKYTRQYLDCLAALGVDTIDHFPKASEHIKEIQNCCRDLIDRGFAYAADGNVWFDVSRDRDYGKLSNRRPEEQEAGTRDLEGSGKRSPADFALWKAAKRGEPQWDSPWGPGRPGWHIECSAMSMKLLGPTFDVHGGGMDLMFPHHENELAQSESATGQTFAKYWMHNGLTRIKTKLAGGELKSEKMSKSVGNVIDARQLIDQRGADLVRYLLLTTHYRSPIDFGDEVLEASKKGLEKFARLFERLARLTGRPLDAKSPDGRPAEDMDAASGALLESSPHGAFVKAVLGLKMKFLEMMDDDFNTAGAIAVMHELAGEVNAFLERTDAERAKPADALAAAAAATHTLRNLGTVLGLFRQPAQAAGAAKVDAAGGALLDQVMQLVIRLRNDARKTKNFPLADAIRNGLTEIGVTLEDRADGTTWRKA